MKRLHVPSPVPDFSASLPFHGAGVDEAPRAANGDRAAGMPDGPRADFVLSPRACRA